MKELSIEQKARAYDEVVKRAKIEKEKSRNLGLLEFIDENFPELMESKDERIKKEIISAVNIYCSEYSRGAKVREDMIAWLEKQQKLTENIETPMSLDEAIEHCKEKSCANNACALEHKQLEKWLTELKELKEQTPAEWSEEDEKYSSYICAALDCYYRLRENRNNTNGQENLDKARNWLLNKLKYLRPSSQWKPSDEQIKAVRLARSFLSDVFDERQILVELEKQLKKLKGE